MAKFGGNEFIGVSVPLVYEGRYFILEPGNPPLLSVFLLVGGRPVFEILKNEPQENKQSDPSTAGTDVVAVSDKQSGKFLYRARPGSETSVVFGKLDGGEVDVRITDRAIQAGGNTLENNTFQGAMAGVVVREDGSVGIGAPLPQPVVDLLSGN